MEIRKLILVPALITLGVTLLRLTGEILRWSPRFFSREAGGAGAIVGIVWLVPIFGIYFALRLARQGMLPASRFRPIGFALLGFLMMIATIRVTQAWKPGPLGAIATFAVVSLLAGAVAYRGWPALGRVQFAYALAARIPVAIVMLIAMLADWGTHYELGPPSFPEMAVLAKWFWIGLLPQLTLWVGFTLVVGGLFGGIAVAAIGAARRPAAA
jgi:hypothetical protein